jgi:hypothetical protein
MKIITIALLIGCLFVSSAFAGLMSTKASVPVRSSAVLTTSYVLGTTFTAATLGAPYNKIEGVHVYGELALGSLTNCIVTAAAATESNCLATSYTLNWTQTQTVTTSGPFHLYFTKTDLGGPMYWGIAAKGTGTPTDSLLSLRVKPQVKDTD